MIVAVNAIYANCINCVHFCIKKPEKKIQDFNDFTSIQKPTTNHQKSPRVLHLLFQIQHSMGVNSRRFLYPGQEPHCTRQLHITCIKTESIRKLSNFNFHWTKTLYQNNLNNIAFFFTFFKGYRCNQLSVITPKKISYEGLRK